MSKKIKSRKKKYDEDTDLHSDETFFLSQDIRPQDFPTA